MRKLSQKIVALFVSVVMVLSFSLTSYAATSNVDRTVTISGITYAIEKSENGVVTVTDKDTGGVAVFNKNTGILTVKERPDSKEVVININDLINNASKGSNSSSDNKYAYSNYLKYYNGKPYTFLQIQIPDQIKYTYEKNNATNLYNFQSNVDTMRSAQDAIGWAWGATGLSIVLGIIAITPVGALAAAILAVASVLSGGPGIYELINYSTTIKNCQTNCVTYFNSVVPVSIP